MHGRHNVLNTVAAIVSLDEGMTYSSISKSLKTFPVERRFEIISKNVFEKQS